MEDIETLRKFIDGSDVSREIKDALFDCVLLQIRNSPSTDFLKVITGLREKLSNEN
jgi:hypothetical protein